MSVVKNPQKVYVGNLPRDVTESEIEKIFREVGKVISFEFKGDFAFIEYSDPYEAEEAIKSLDRLTLHGRKLVVEAFRYRGGDPRYRRPPPKGKRGQFRLIISGISSDTNAEDIRKWAESEKLHSIVLTDVYNRHGMSEGVIEFLDQDEFDTASRTLEGMKLNGHSVRVSDERDYNRRKLRAYGTSSKDRGRDRDRSRGRERDRFRDGERNDHGGERRRRGGDAYGEGDTRDRYLERDYHDREDSRNNSRRKYGAENGYHREPRTARSRTRSRSRDNDRYRERSRDQNKEKEVKKSRTRSREKKEKERDPSREKKKDHEREHERERDRERDRSHSRSKDKKKKENSREKGRSGSRTKGRSRS